MRPHLYALSALLIAGCMACSTDDGARQSPPQSDEVRTIDEAGEKRAVEISSHLYSVRLREGEGLSFTNRHGDLRIRLSGDSGVHYAAMIQKLDGEQRDVEFPANRQAGGLAFSVNPPDDWIGRVDSSARVPRNSALDLSTTDGLIELRTGTNAVKAQSTTGEIRYRGAGTIDAFSEHGNIEVSMQGLHYDGTAGSIVTGGNIELWLMPGADLTVHCEAGGETFNEVPAELGKMSLANGMRRLELGAGTSRLDVQAGGDIVIHALPAP